MAIRLFIVEGAFAIKARGLVLVPGLSWDRRDVVLRIGQRVELRRPDGTRAGSTIAGIEMLSPNPARTTPIMLAKGIQKADVPIGTEVWTSD